MHRSINTDIDVDVTIDDDEIIAEIENSPELRAKIIAALHVVDDTPRRMAALFASLDPIDRSEAWERIAFEARMLGMC